MMDVSLFLLLCAPMFFLRILIMLFFSQNKNRYTKMNSISPYTFVTISVRPKSMPRRMTKNICKRREKF